MEQDLLLDLFLKIIILKNGTHIRWKTAKKVSVNLLKKQVGTIAQGEMAPNTKISMDTTVIEERRTKQEFRQNNWQPC